MIRFVLAPHHPFHNEEVRVFGDCEALGRWVASWSRELFGPGRSIASPADYADQTASLLIPVGVKTISFRFVAIRKNRLLRGQEKKVTVPRGVWRLTDAGYSGIYTYELEREEPRCSPTYWPGSDVWSIFDASAPSRPAFALRGPRNGRAETLVVYLHPLHGRLDKPATSIFTDPYAPPAYAFWHCMEHTVVLMPACPPLLKGVEEEGSGQWVHENWERSLQAGQILHDLIESVRIHYNIKSSRVVAFGTSNGGYGILEMLGQFPALFSKAAVISAHIETPAREVAAKIPRDVPLYFWHCVNDVICPSSDIVNLVGHLREDGKNVDIWMGVDSMSENGHEAASQHAIQHGMIDWLLAPTWLSATAHKDFVEKHGGTSSVDFGMLRLAFQQYVSDEETSRARWVKHDDDGWHWKKCDAWWSAKENGEGEWDDNRPESWSSHYDWWEWGTSDGAKKDSNGWDDRQAGWSSKSQWSDTARRNSNGWGDGPESWLSDSDWREQDTAEAAKNNTNRWDNRPESWSSDSDWLEQDMAEAAKTNNNGWDNGLESWFSDPKWSAWDTSGVVKTENNRWDNRPSSWSSDSEWWDENTPDATRNKSGGPESWFLTSHWQKQDNPNTVSNNEWAWRRGSVNISEAHRDGWHDWKTTAQARARDVVSWWSRNTTDWTQSRK